MTPTIQVYLNRKNIMLSSALSDANSDWDFRICEEGSTTDTPDIVFPSFNAIQICASKGVTEITPEAQLKTHAINIFATKIQRSKFMQSDTTISSDNSTPKLGPAHSYTTTIAVNITKSKMMYNLVA